MEAERYLDRIKTIDAIIDNKLSEYQRWVCVADGMGGASIGDRVQTTRNLHSSADAIGRYIDIEREIEALRFERHRILETIEQLPSTEYVLIYKLYVQSYSMKELEFFFGMSYEWVKWKKKHALMLVQDILDSETVQTSTESG